MAKVIDVVLKNGHIAQCVPIAQELVDSLELGGPAKNYSTFYLVTIPNYSGAKRGNISWVIGKGDVRAPKQWVVWYPNRMFWSGFGLTIKEALNGAIDSAWFYI